MKEEIIECMDVLYLQRDRVLEEQEEVRITKVSHGETRHVHDVIGCVSSLGRRKYQGFLGVPNMPEYVRSACDNKKEWDTDRPGWESWFV